MCTVASMQRLLLSPSSPIRPGKQAPHVLGFVAQAALPRAAQAGAEEQSTRFNTALAVARVCLIASALPAPKDSCDRMAAVAAVESV